MKAVKASTPESQSPAQTRSVRLQIPGLHPVYDGEDFTFELVDVKICDVDYTLVIDNLVQQGVPSDIVDHAIDDLAGTIWIQTMSRTLAERMVRK